MMGFKRGFKARTRFKLKPTILKVAGSVSFDIPKCPILTTELVYAVICYLQSFADIYMCLSTIVLQTSKFLVVKY